MRNRIISTPREIDASRWPHVVVLSTRYIGLCAQQYEIALPAVTDWLDEHAPNDGWRLAMNRIPGTYPQHPTGAFIQTTRFVRQVHLSDADAAFAFRLRFGG